MCTYTYTSLYVLRFSSLCVCWEGSERTVMCSKAMWEPAAIQWSAVTVQCNMLHAGIKYAPMCLYGLCVYEYLSYLITVKCSCQSIWLTIILLLFICYHFCFGKVLRTDMHFHIYIWLWKATKRERNWMKT